MHHAGESPALYHAWRLVELVTRNRQA